MPTLTVSPAITVTVRRASTSPPSREKRARTTCSPALTTKAWGTPISAPSSTETREKGIELTRRVPVSIARVIVASGVSCAATRGTRRSITRSVPRSRGGDDASTTVGGAVSSRLSGGSGGGTAGLDPASCAIGIATGRCDEGVVVVRARSAPHVIRSAALTTPTPKGVRHRVGACSSDSTGAGEGSAAGTSIGTSGGNDGGEERRSDESRPASAA